MTERYYQRPLAMYCYVIVNALISSCLPFHVLYSMVLENAWIVKTTSRHKVALLIKFNGLGLQTIASRFRGVAGCVWFLLLYSPTSSFPLPSFLLTTNAPSSSSTTTILLTPKYPYYNPCPPSSISSTTLPPPLTSPLTTPHYYLFPFLISSPSPCPLSPKKLSDRTLLT